MDVRLVHPARQVRMEVSRQELVVQFDREIVEPDAIAREQRVLVFPVRVSQSAAPEPHVTVADIRPRKVLATAWTETERKIDASHPVAAFGELENAPDDYCKLIRNA